MRKTKRTRPVIGVDNAHRRLSLKAKKQGWPFITLYTNNGMGKPVRGYLQKKDRNGFTWLKSGRLLKERAPKPENNFITKLVKKLNTRK